MKELKMKVIEGIKGKSFLVTGGLGFVGASLCIQLIQNGAYHVRSLDFRSSSPWSSQLSQFGVISIRGDITRKEDVNKAVKGVDCVFHIASYGMSGKEMLQTARVNKINIDGTRIILDACVEFGVKRLVYVSTYNVVFARKEIVNGDESLPYLPLDDHGDPYGRSKSIAEQLVLKYNGHPLREAGGCLHSCAIRPAAIYGPGDEKVVPRIIYYAKLGLFVATIGDTSIKTDWLYVDNLVHALLLASMGLLQENPVAAGQSYFISDGSPVNSFEFFRPLIESLGYTYPKASLTVPLALALGKICQVPYDTILSPLINVPWLPQPFFLLPTEIYKVGVTHYCSVRKAEKELGYVPKVSPQEGMSVMISYWQRMKRKSLDSPTFITWIFCICGLFSLLAVNFLEDFGPVALLRAILLFFLRSIENIRIISCIVATKHVTEATFAWFLAKKIDPANAKGWFWQTLLLATFSSRLLIKRAGPSVHQQVGNGNCCLPINNGRAGNQL